MVSTTKQPAAGDPQQAAIPTITTLDQSYLSQEQVIQLLQFVDKFRVSNLRGRSHMEAYDIRAHLNRIFGFGRWSEEITTMDLVYEAPCQTTKGPGYEVTYKAACELTVCAPDGTHLARYKEWAIGSQKMGVTNRGDCHDFAMKTAESQAFKRAAINLGDQFGLSLYNKGSLNAIVGGTFLYPGRKDTLVIEGPKEQLGQESDPDFDTTLLEQPAQPQQQAQQAPPQQNYQQQPPAPQQQQQQPGPAAQHDTQQSHGNMYPEGQQQQPPQQPAPAAQQVPQGPFEPGSIQEARASLQADIQKLPTAAKNELMKLWGRNNLPPLYQISSEDDLAMCWALFGSVVQKPQQDQQPEQQTSPPPASPDPQHAPQDDNNFYAQA